MPAPTALQRAPSPLATEEAFHDAPQSAIDTPNDLITTSATTSSADQIPESDIDMDSTPLFAPESHHPRPHPRPEERKIRIPPHRMTPLKASWPKIYPPLVTHLHLQIRMNPAKKAVELRTSPHTTDPSALQKGADFLTAFTLGFDLDDAIALLRLDDLYIQSFEIKDVKGLSGEHMGRAVGRIAGKDGKTKFAIENASRTRIVLADTKVHILGGFKNLSVAREAVVSLILGSPPSKVYGNLRTVSARMKERF
ncbi:Pre-rRNA-processing protein PNO1 [Salinomyces thailandicus]|uniref:Pre-rRNA-processing protein PNO1 n=1 Tax=Salinomyces thailandicus TaxID=706561 RepID=A0A4U0TL63_9PEZI|nr:Pre-rRNA-processing protein PNO1 [Salinomyces thailandica]